MLYTICSFVACSDLATMSEDGYLTIAGRIKDVVIRGGENLYPVEIEQFLYKHPKIEDVQVINADIDNFSRCKLGCAFHVMDTFSITLCGLSSSSTNSPRFKMYRSLCGRQKGPSMTRYARSYSLQKGPSLEDSVE